MAFRDETWQITADLRQHVNNVVDDEIRALTRAWVRAWDGVVAEFAAAAHDIADSPLPVTPAQIRRMRRARRALRQAHTSIVRMLTDAGVRIEATTGALVAETIAADARAIASQYPRTARVDAGDFERVDPRALESIVERTTRQITSYGWPLADDAYEAMVRALVQAIPRGLGPRDVARRIVRAVEGQFNGGLARALNITRTELLDAHRDAAYLNQLANADVLDGWMWTAKLDRATCPSCIAQHGNVYPLDEPGPNDHQSGRCARTPVTKTWRQLGFDMREPNRTVTSGRQWFAGQTADVQRSILGPGRYELYRTRQITFDDLSTVRRTAGWRDSYVATPLRELV